MVQQKCKSNGPDIDKDKMYPPQQSRITRLAEIVEPQNPREPGTYKVQYFFVTDMRETILNLPETKKIHDEHRFVLRKNTINDTEEAKTRK